MAEAELKAVKKSIKKLDKLCRTFERNPEREDDIYNAANYKSWRKELASLRKKENMLMAQQRIFIKVSICCRS
jgi:hypothetical protein